MSYSNPSEAPSYSKIYQRAPSNNYETEPGSFNVSAPSLSKAVGMMNNEPHSTISQRSEQNGEALNVQGPSRSDMRHGGGISASGNSSGLLHSDASNSVGQSPGISKQAHPNYSEPADQGNNTYNADQTPAGISGQARPNHSESAQPSTDDNEPPQDDAGMSMVGKKYKEVNPTAYYVEK